MIESPVSVHEGWLFISFHFFFKSVRHLESFEHELSLIEYAAHNFALIAN